MENIKKSCHTGEGALKCVKPEEAIAVAAKTKSEGCGICPTCPAPCNPNPQSPEEKEIQRLNIKLQQLEENHRLKIAEVAVLRADFLRKKAELDKERIQSRDVRERVKELELKYEGIGATPNVVVIPRPQYTETMNCVRSLKQCYRESREETEDLHKLLKEQTSQSLEYKNKYLQAQQMIEEQRKQMDIMDMDNNRVADQINLEIQKIKNKFQEKLQEYAPLPDQLKATQMRLMEAQQAQAVAEHNAANAEKDLSDAREKVHALLHNALKPPEKPDRSAEDRMGIMLQQRIDQLTEIIRAQKKEIEGLKSTIFNMENAVLMNEKRLLEKMHECTVLGGDLDRIRDEAGRAQQRANERVDTIRECMNAAVSELERQLAMAQAKAETAEKDRAENAIRMECQLKRKNDLYQQTFLRMLELQTIVATLRRAREDDEGDGDGETKPEEDKNCTCMSLFDEP